MITTINSSNETNNQNKDKLFETTNHIIWAVIKKEHKDNVGTITDNVVIIPFALNGCINHYELSNNTRPVTRIKDLRTNKIYDLKTPHTKYMNADIELSEEAIKSISEDYGINEKYDWKYLTTNSFIHVIRNAEGIYSYCFINDSIIDDLDSTPDEKCIKSRRVFGKDYYCWNDKDLNKIKIIDEVFNKSAEMIKSLDMKRFNSMGEELFYQSNLLVVADRCAEQLKYAKNKAYEIKSLSASEENEKKKIIEESMNF